jgi:hypothetical protein
MYIQIGDKNYPCTNYRPAKGVRAIFYGVEDLTLPVEDEIILFADDGFELATIVTGDFERQVYEHGTLTLTNEPEPESIPEPDPVEPSPTVEDYLIDLDYRLSLIELGVN